MAEDLGIPFALSSYRSASLPISAQQVVNFYTQVQRQGMDAKTPAALFGCPGVVQFAAVGSGPIRAMTEMAGVLYAVSGSQLYSIDSAGVGTVLGGGIKPGSNVLGIANSGTEVLIVDGTNGFSYKPGVGYAQVSDTDFVAAKTAVYLNGYFLLDRVGTNQFGSSDADDGRSYNALFFSSAETNPDNVEACLSHHQQLYLTGKKGIEVWQFNPNTSAFPWIKYPGAAIQVGVAGPFAATTHKEQVYFVGSDKLLYRLDGANPVSVSDPGVAAQWKRYGDISDVFIFGITWGLQEWIVITFPSVPATWVFDGTTGFFHERVSQDNAMASLGRWRANAHASCYNKQLIGDYSSNKIGYLDDDTFTEFGFPIQSRVVSPNMHRKGSTVFMSSLEVLMEAGVGLISGQGSDPQIVLDWSNDGGIVFEPYQMSKSFGARGQRETRTRFTHLGSFDQRVYRLTITDPVKRVLISAIPKAAGGLSYS